VVFGGLVSFKDFRTTDEIFVLQLNTDVGKKPVCNICKSSFRAMPRIDP
jgi:hypothetical protein